MSTEGMKYWLVSREVIADSIETVVGCEGMDGIVAVGGCDKNMPGCLISIARLNRPAVFVYGGTILPGRIRLSQLSTTCRAESDGGGSTIKQLPVSVFEAIGAHANKKSRRRGIAGHRNDGRVQTPTGDNELNQTCPGRGELAQTTGRLT